MLLSAPRLHQLIDENVITALHENVNSASIDIRIGDTILVEDFSDIGYVDIDQKQTLKFMEIKMDEKGFIVEPGQCFLAHSIEYFNLPDTISADFKLRSTLGRCFLEHMKAGWCDAGWHGAQLTMEFKNMSQHHSLLIKPGMRVGQITFFEHEPVGDDSYAVKGNYNNQEGATKAFDGEGHNAN